jgi:hypothetical protein
MLIPFIIILTQIFCIKQPDATFLPSRPIMNNTLPSRLNVDDIITPTNPRINTTRLQPIDNIGLQVPSLEDVSRTNADFENSAVAMLSAYRAAESSRIAISAAAKAVASCSSYANIDCEEIMRSQNKTEEYIEIAAQSSQQAQVNAQVAKKAVTASRYILGNEPNASGKKVNARFADIADQIANSAAQQAKIAVDVTASAQAQCNLIVHIKCNVCKQNTTAT